MVRVVCIRVRTNTKMAADGMAKDCRYVCVSMLVFGMGELVRETRENVCVYVFQYVCICLCVCVVVCVRGWCGVGSTERERKRGLMHL